MNDNEKKPGDWKMILGGIVLVIVLFACIKFVLWGLEQVIRQDVPDVSSSASVSRGEAGEQDAPSFCVHCGRALPGSFRWGQFCPWCGEKNER